LTRHSDTILLPLKNVFLLQFTGKKVLYRRKDRVYKAKLGHCLEATKKLKT